MRLTIPNQLTILRIILTPVFIYFFVQESAHSKLIGTIIFTLASATDWYDGYIARRMNVVTRWGQFMDPLADKILVLSAFCMFAHLKIIYWWMVWIIITRDFIITLLRMYAIERGKSIVTSMLAKWKTFSQMLIIFILLIYTNLIQYSVLHDSGNFLSYYHWVTVATLIVTLITAVSGLIYLVENRRHFFEIFRRLIRFFV